MKISAFEYSVKLFAGPISMFDVRVRKVASIALILLIIMYETPDLV